MLAVKLLEGEIAKGDEVEVDAEGGGLSFGDHALFLIRNREAGMSKNVVRIKFDQSL